MIRVHEIHTADKANHGINLPALFPNEHTPPLQVDSLGLTGGILILHLSVFSLGTSSATSFTDLTLRTTVSFSTC